MDVQEKDYLEVYRKQQEERLGWGKGSEWTNQDFDALSELIFEKTNIRLSASTLKRVWGKVKYDSAPTLTTLNTLAQFSGYENWRTFRTSVDAQNKKSDVIIEQQTESISSTDTYKPQHAVTRVAISIVFFLAVTLFYFFSFPPAKTDVSKVKFTARVLTDDLPNSVVFDYDVPNKDIDSVIIQQSWDPRRRETVSVKDHQHTSLYYEPGFFQAKLIVNNQIVKEQGLLIKTNGWKGIVFHEYVPFYLSKEEIMLNENSMRVSGELLRSKTGKTVFNNIWTGFHNIRKFDRVDSDNFSVDAVLQNTSSKEEAACQNVRLTVVGSKGVIVIPFSGKGCTAAISAYLIDELVDGKKKDLSAFGCDFSMPQHISLHVKNKTVTIFNNQAEIFSHALSSGLGSVVGVVVSFEGSGKIENLSIK